MPRDSVPFPAFTPVALRVRRDGWTPARQRAFVALLAETRSVSEACRRLGLSRESAYKLFRRPDAASFRAAWQAAFAGPKPPRPAPAVRRAAAAACAVRRAEAPETRCASRPLRPLSPARRRPAYSLEAFVRAARAAKAARATANAGRAAPVAVGACQASTSSSLSTSAPPPEGRCHASTSSTSSTSAAGGGDPSWQVSGMQASSTSAAGEGADARAAPPFLVIPDPIRDP